MTRAVHVIPVPDGMTPDEAWWEIRVFGHLAEGRTVDEDGSGGAWAVIEIDEGDDDA